VLGSRPVSLYVQGNIGPHRTEDSQPEEWFVRPDNRGREQITRKRHEAPPITTTSAREAYEQVLANVGCTRPMRDAVDERVINDVKSRRTRIVNDPKEVGGWPVLAAGTPPADGDHGGMPDAWETRRRFASTDPSDGASDADGDGYTNAEEFLNATDPRKAELPSAPRSGAR
jgi:hypothetical protein